MREEKYIVKVNGLLMCDMGTLRHTLQLKHEVYVT